MRVVASLLAVALLAAGAFAQTQTIAEIVDSSAVAGLLKSLLVRADLLSSLNDTESELTLFAPTDEAFSALPEAVLDSIVSNNTLLREVLLYHVVQSVALATDLPEGETTVESLQGDSLVIRKEGDVVTVNGEEAATVVQADVAASNGVVHVIDAVLVPPGITLGEGPTTAPALEAGDEEAAAAPKESPKDAKAPGGDTPMQQTVLSIIENGEQTTQLKALLETYEIADYLEPGEVYTVFAPTDEAITQVDPATFERIATDDALATAVLQYHVVRGALGTQELAAQDGGELETLEGSMLPIVVDGDNLTVGGFPLVLDSEQQGTDGYVHLLQGVLVPPSVAEQAEVTPAPSEDANVTEPAATPREAPTEADEEGTASNAWAVAVSLATLAAAGLMQIFVL
ncbi:unnamed protein product [Vitrella brassicaformis CCMP3155]|uniref:FAS1 domain-containing protein n=1 Tax=Vitrella brassicaformis (strain CCMP3155) TaxID=1169540 RepID=A0A0G4EX86_VITBC|nr:unnamed protein product [Vitrella brassicaformis CCMP3155]|mmetsp:Transcript_27669/g.68984  ORF Transcript_27669/g.68984 Transcript_27669/m.68984 type:complete len:400 (-) Transcript_27669:973-2172(-)|eukprot:CEM03408.1 unnamed protein product [Vitrella brassicaformis CCMP3155]